MGHGPHGILLAIKNTGWPTVIESLVPGNLDHASLRGNIPFENDQTSIGFERVRKWMDYLLSRCLYSCTHCFAKRSPIRGHLPSVNQTIRGESFDQDWHPSGTI